jgi:hypothetical protein
VRNLLRDTLSCLGGAVALLAAFWGGYGWWLGYPLEFWSGLFQELMAGRWDEALAAALLVNAAGMVLAGRPGPVRGMLAGAFLAVSLVLRLWLVKASGYTRLHQVLMDDRVEVALLALPVILGGAVAGWLRR